MSSMLIAAGRIAAASQSTVFVTMIDDGEGSGSGTTILPGGSISGTLFGAQVTECFYTSSGFRVDIAGSASGQSFFRQVRVNSGTLLNSSAATYSSANNTWTWDSGVVGVSAGSYTLQFFR